MGCQEDELSILLLDDAGIREINRTYLKKNRPTDVISFPQNDVMCRPGRSRLLGDVVISLDTVQRQALQSGNRLEAEFAFLLIHGVLHLLGYDHEASASATRKMTLREKALLNTLNKQNLL